VTSTASANALCVAAQILALWAGKKLILLPQTLGPFKSRWARAMGKYIMKRAVVIYSRDHAGIKQVENWLGLEARSGRLKFCYDVDSSWIPYHRPESTLSDFL